MSMSPEIRELLLRLLQQETEHAVILLDRTGVIVSWLGAAEKTFGYRPEEVIGRPVENLFTEEDRTANIPEYELNVASSNGHAEDDRWMQSKGQHRFWATGALLPIRDDEGAILGFGKILRNRTDLKAQFQSGQNQIEHLQKANQSKDNFITTLAHELRTPLAAIKHCLAILEIAGSQDDECRFARTTAERQLDHAQRMIEDLLEVAKADIGKIQLHLRERSLTEILKAAMEACQPTLGRYTQHADLIAADHPIMVYADSSRLEQVFVNLIENAAKYTDPGGNIWVKVSVEDEDAVVRIEDTGIGISPELLPRIFDLFTQAEQSTQKSGGLGIGLSLVKEFTALHGGTVQVHSDGLGKGSEFTVRLPLARTEAGRKDSSNSP